MDPRDSRFDEAEPSEQGAVKRPRVVLAGDARWGLAWGFVLVLAGVALLLDHMGLTPVDRLYRFWPLLLVLFGLMNITTRSGRGFGFVLILVGALLQLNSLDVIHLSNRDFWPIVIIGIGVLLVWGSLESRGYVRAKRKIDWTKAGATDAFRKHIEEAYANDPNSLHAVALFSGCERRYSGQHFQGGKAVAVFGGVELDFRDADIDDEAVLEINCIFGGVEIRVPDTWAVHSRSLPVFGGFEDKSRRVKVVDPTGTTKPKTLVITGVVVFGGVEISN